MYENNDFTNGYVLGRDNGNNDGFGGSNGAWWIIILLIFCWGGFGGFGGFGRAGAAAATAAGAAENYTLASDFATIQRQLSDGFASVEKKGDGIANGLCDGFYSTAQLINGVSQNLNTQAYETRNAVQQAQVSGMQNTNALATQISDVNYNVASNANNIINTLNQCCCDNRAAIADVNYNIATQNSATQRLIENGFANTSYQMATDTCAINTNIANSTRDIVDSQNSNTRAILDALTAQRLADKDAQLAVQAQQISALQLAASQQAQNAYLINQLKPCPAPAYVVANPYCNCNSSYGTTIS